MNRLIAFTIPWLVLLWVGTTQAEAAKKKRSSKGTLVVVSTVDGAAVIINGLKAGTTPLSPQKLRAKTYRIKVTKLGHLAFEDKIRVRPGKRIKVLADLMPVSGVISVGPKLKGARILLDGKAVGKAPLDFEIGLGTHRVVVRAQGKQDLVKVVKAIPGEVVAIRKPLLPVFEEDPLALAPLARKAEPEDPLALVPLGANDEAEEDPLALTPLKPKVARPAAPAAPVVSPDPLMLTQEIPALEPWYQTWWALGGAGAAIVGTAVLTAVLMNGKSVPLGPQPDTSIALEPSCTNWDDC